MVSESDLQAGLLAHARWKRRLLDAVKTGSSEFDPIQVSSADKCEFGQWLHSLPASDRDNEHYRKVTQLHNDFHKAAGEILRLALKGETEKATELLEYGGPYSHASGKLVLAMQRWKSSL